MSQYNSHGLQQFKNFVGIRFQLYNSLFTGLPFHKIEKTGILLSMLLDECEEGYAQGYSPTAIIQSFFSKHVSFHDEKEKLDLLFRFVQFIERQVVLFDALEDAAFTQVNDMGGAGTLKQLVLQIKKEQKELELQEKLKTFSVRMVLTAHPTQFYPGQVLGIINDLSKAMADNNALLINSYLQQLGKTAFLKKQKPTPYDEAVSLIWYLENVFYAASGRIVSYLKQQFPAQIPDDVEVINMGFWPGGDRDGNPFVNAATTLQVAEALRGSIIKCYYQDVRKLKRRLTFKGIEPILNVLEEKLYKNVFIPGQKEPLTKTAILSSLYEVKKILIADHNSMFLELLDRLINKVGIFGLHFASLDIRQEASIHGHVLEYLGEHTAFVPKGYAGLSDAEKLAFLSEVVKDSSVATYEDALVQDTLDCIKAIAHIQGQNGTKGCDRYIISQCSSALNVMEVYGLFGLCGIAAADRNIDIVPLFETVDDLENAAAVMQTLYSNSIYQAHLTKRGNKQTIMLGFSDGTKDGGYLMANWGIYKAKESLTAISKQHDVDVVFFDGRGGPPSRGGGKTHQFYASMGKNIANKEIQLTVQGQTVSTSFGTIDAATFNLEQMIHAGISNALFSNKETTLTSNEENLLSELAQHSYEEYSSLKNHPGFLDYLTHVSPLQYYGDTNIGSRPTKRAGNDRFNLKDLRAIPYVGAWSQLKQNVTGYYGLGTAFKRADDDGKLPAIIQLYNNSMFFKTLLGNAEMAMKKCFFPLTQYLSKEEKYAPVWQKIYDEYELSKKYVGLVSGKTALMDDYPVEQLSISMRERIILPLLTIQQFAMSHMRNNDTEGNQISNKSVYEKLIIRSSFGIINAGRNSV